MHPFKASSERGSANHPRASFHRGKSQGMGDGAVELVVLGVAQDGGVPQAGCSCVRCVAALEDPELRLDPGSCAVCGIDGSLHLIEVSRVIPEQLGILSRRLGLDRIAMPEPVCLTPTHLGHIDGLGLVDGSRCWGSMVGGNHLCGRRSGQSL